jgi:acylphosphatase
MIQQKGMKRVHIIIHGSVQGVFFRASIEDRANQLGLTGYVQNRKEGTVEVVIEGPADKVKEMTRYCKHGPTFAKVKAVDMFEEEFEDEFDSFFVKR